MGLRMKLVLSRCTSALNMVIKTLTDIRDVANGSQDEKLRAMNALNQAQRCLKEALEHIRRMY